MIKRLCKKKEIIENDIAQALIAHEKRVELTLKRGLLYVKEEILEEMQGRERRTLQRTADEEEKLQQFLIIKGRRRILTDLEAAMEEERLQKRENMEKKLGKANQMITRITEYFDEEDVEQIIDAYNRRDVEIYGLFMYATDKYVEIATSSESSADFRSKIVEKRKFAIDRKKIESETIESLKLKLEECERRLEVKEAIVEKTKSRMDGIFAGVKKMFTMIKADDTPILNLLGDTVDVTPKNVRLYFEIIERRIDEIINYVFYTEENIVKKIVSYGEEESVHEMMPEEDIEPKKNKCIKEDQHPSIKMEPLEDIVFSSLCPLCIKEHAISQRIFSEGTEPLTKPEIINKLDMRMEMYSAGRLTHNISKCRMPEATVLIQGKYR